MARYLFLMILVFPAIELAILIKFGSWIGVFPTLLAIFSTAALGVYFIRLQGLGMLFAMRSKLEQGELPVLEVLDGFMLALAGLCLLIPGFLSDAVGFLLLLPQLRFLFVRALIKKPFVTTHVARHQTPEYTQGRTINSDDYD